MKTLWYEDENGNDLGNCIGEDGNIVDKPDNARYMVSRFPTELKTYMYRLNDDDTTKQIMESSSSWSDELVTAMVRSGEFTAAEAILLAALACERCMNALAFDQKLSWGYKRYSEEFNNCKTECDQCKQRDVVVPLIGVETNIYFDLIDKNDS